MIWKINRYEDLQIFQGLRLSHTFISQNWGDGLFKEFTLFPPSGKKILKFQSKSIFTFLLIADINSRFSFHSLSGFAIFQSTFLCLNFINFSTCQLNLNLSVLLLNIIIMNICLYTSLYTYLSVFRTTAVIKIFWRTV